MLLFVVHIIPTAPTHHSRVSKPQWVLGFDNYRSKCLFSLQTFVFVWTFVGDKNNAHRIVNNQHIFLISGLDVKGTAILTILALKEKENLLIQFVRVNFVFRKVCNVNSSFEKKVLPLGQSF